jgi:hypothetical protein
MNVSHLLYLGMRVAHVLLAAAWLGASLFFGRVLYPAVESLGAAGGDVLAALSAKKIHAFFGAVGGLTVVTGIYLYWHFTAGFNPEISASRGGIAFGVGAVCGLVAVIVGGSVVGRSAERAVALGKTLAQAPERERAAMQAEIAALRGRVKRVGAFLEVLLVIAVIAMALGHYI